MTTNYDAALGDPRTPEGMRKHCIRRMKVLGARRQSFEQFWNEEMRFCEVVSSRILSSYTQGLGGNRADYVNYKNQDQLNSKLLDPRAVHASETMANGFYSGMSSPSRPWFKVTIADKDLREFQAVKVYIDERERRIYDLLSSTNFYTILKGGYRQLGVYGTEAGLMEQHWQYGMVSHPLKVGEYWLGLDDGLVPDTLYRRADMTALQHYQRFLKGREDQASKYLPRKVVEAFDRGNYDTVFPVYNAIEPNDLREPGRMDYRGKPYRSVYWSAVCEAAEGETYEKALLTQEGFHSKPFWTGRWDVQGNDAYSLTCPGLNALADVRQLQLEVLRKQQATDYAIRPPLRGPATLNNIHAALQPGRITAMAGIDKDSFGAIWEVDARAIEMIRQDVIGSQEAVDRGFYVQLFTAITNMPGVQPRNLEEIAKRNEEQLNQLGPVTERVNHEKLRVVIQRADEILERTGGYADLEMPEELHGVGFQIEFISTLAQAQRLVGLGAIERVWGFATSIADATQGASLDSLDADTSVAEYADITGVAAKIVRGKDEIEKIRAGRAQQQQAAQAAEMAKTVAPALKQGAETAQILYNSPGSAGEPSIAQRLLGQ